MWSYKFRLASKITNKNKEKKTKLINAFLVGFLWKPNS